MTPAGHRPSESVFEAWQRMPCGLMSLWAIMNNVIGQACTLLSQLSRLERSADDKIRTPLPLPPRRRGGLEFLGTGTLPPQIRVITEAEKQDALEILYFAEIVSGRLELDAAQDRIKRFRTKLANEVRIEDFKNEISALREAAEDQLNKRFCYYVKKDKAAIGFALRNDWASPLQKFPSAREEIKEAVRCYLMESNTACVFHCMRIAEIGLRALARERKITIPKKPIEWATWQDIISKIRTDVSNRIGKKRAGPAKDAALEFYSGALGEFEAFKDVYRNSVMHVRTAYDEDQAKSVLTHVREFMARLSSKIDEHPKKQISWKIR